MGAAHDLVYVDRMVVCVYASWVLWVHLNAMTVEENGGGGIEPTEGG